jgi:hypothetical protein
MKLFLTSAFVLISCIISAQKTNIISIDTKSPGRTFEGIGGVSAGASSRLLIDYPEPYRSQILDYLFKPNWGAAFQHLKVEAGGDFNSTDGSEPSHARTLEEFTNPKPEYFQRGYEWWLMEEAVKRDSSIILDCLQWCAPDWVRTEPGKRDLCSQQNADYLVNFIKGAKKYHNLNLNLVGIWNEVPYYSTEYIKLLRKTLDRNNLTRVRIVAADQSYGGDVWRIATQMKNDPELARAVDFVSAHYPGYLNYLGFIRFDITEGLPKPEFSSTQDAKDCGKPLWASEHGPWRDDWKGAEELARIYNRNYIDGKMTRTEIWAPVTSYYDILPVPRSGVLRANTPWSGNYVACPTVWATAHTTQFAKPGWRYLDQACGYLPDSGSYVTLVSPKDKDISVIIETFDASGKQNIQLTLPAGFKSRKFYVWHTSGKDDPSHWFIRVAEIIPEKGILNISLENNSIYTITTTTGQKKGDAQPPPYKPLTLPYEDDFSTFESLKSPRYFSDQIGAFEVTNNPSGGEKVLQQVILKPGIPWGSELTGTPYTIMGDTSWCNYLVETDAKLPGDSSVAILYGRVGSGGFGEDQHPESYFLKVKGDGSWQIGKSFIRTTDGHERNPSLNIIYRTFIVILDEGKPASLNLKPDQWFRMGFRLNEKRVIAMINGKQISNFMDTNALQRGLIGLGSSFDNVSFARLKITPINPN